MVCHRIDFIAFFRAKMGVFGQLGEKKYENQQSFTILKTQQRDTS